VPRQKKGIIVMRRVPTSAWSWIDESSMHQKEENPSSSWQRDATADDSTAICAAA
jgi:hypothetical protein